MINRTTLLAVLVSLTATSIASPLEIRQVPDISGSTTTVRSTTTTTTTRVTTTITTTGGSPPPATTTTNTGPLTTTSFNTAQIKAMQTALLLAPSQEDKYAILLPNPPDASNITYQFINNTVKAPTGGTIGLSEVDQFPALIGTNVGMAIGFVNPCGLNVPHSHPRANEFLTVTQGTLVAGLVLESTKGAAGNVNGQNPIGPVPLVNATLTNYKGMIFYRGNVHFQFNPTCEPAVFAAAFDSNDPGRAQLAADFFTVQPDDVLLSAIGGDNTLLSASDIDQLRGKIPSAFAELIDSCTKRCGFGSS